MNNKLWSLFVLVLLFSLFFIPMRDSDFGWHYRCGEQFVKQGKLCSVNDFTALLPGYRWTSPSHLYQILLYFSYHFFGFPGVSFAYGLLSALVFWFFLKCLNGPSNLKLITFLLLIWFSWSGFNLGFRSQIVSAYFFAIFLGLFELSDNNRKLLWLTPFLSLIWSNSHSGFFLSPALFILLLAQELFLIALKRGDPKRMAELLIIFALNLLATLINPFGYGIYLEVWQHLQTPLNQLVYEWVAPLPIYSNLVILLSLTFLLIIFVEKRKDIFRLLLLIFLTYLALNARRNLMLYALGLNYIVAEEQLTNFLSRCLKYLVQKELLMIVLIVITLFAISRNISKTLSFNEAEYCREAIVIMPCQAVEFLKDQKPGPVFNAYEWGGFLDWKLPEFKMFIDGRMPTWSTSKDTRLPERWRGKSPYTVYIETMYGVPEWRELMQNYDIDYLLIEAKYPLYELLEKDGSLSSFKRIYQDEIAVVYQRTEN